MDGSFYEKLILLILDKGLLALFIILIGWFVTRTIETYKAKQVVKVEKEKAKNQAMGAIWAEVNAWRVASDEGGGFRIDDDIVKLKNFVTKGFENVRQVIERNRFWAGNDFADAAMIYAGVLLTYYQKYYFERRTDHEGFYKQLREVSLDFNVIEISKEIHKKLKAMDEQSMIILKNMEVSELKWKKLSESERST
jgi:hypothetical protein